MKKLKQTNSSALHLIQYRSKISEGSFSYSFVKGGEKHTHNVAS